MSKHGPHHRGKPHQDGSDRRDQGQTIAKKVLAENINLKNTVRLMIQRETSKANIHARDGGQGKKQR